MNTAEPLRSADNLTRLANVWREVQPTIYREIGDSADARTRFEHLLSPEFLDPIRASTLDPTVERAPVPALENANASTTHFVIVDQAGNIVCATQSLSLHFGAGVVATGTGIIMNDSMSNFAYADAANPNAVAQGRRPRSTICPTIVFENGAPCIAIGLPGGARIPTAMLQVLLDRLVWKRPLAQAIGDTRIHFNPAWRNRGGDAIETEIGLDSTTTAALTAAGWRVNEVEPAGTGLHFGGVNAIEFDPNGGFIGYADPRRTNTAAGY
jgi:gamma-glutamyltranspeptidase / glutathione hydrolase